MRRDRRELAGAHGTSDWALRRVSAPSFPLTGLTAVAATTAAAMHIRPAASSMSKACDGVAFSFKRKCGAILNTGFGSFEVVSSRAATVFGLAENFEWLPAEISDRNFMLFSRLQVEISSKFHTFQKIPVHLLTARSHSRPTHPVSL